MTLTQTLKKMSPKSALSYFEQKLKYEIGPMELKERMDRGQSDFQVIDVRDRDTYEKGHIPGAKSIPYDDFSYRSSDFSEEKENVVYCYSITCQLAVKAAHWLSERGYPVKLLVGGYDEWEKNGLPVEK
ncbi:MAG: rhodanese-like domain-containing protein [Candidatus Abyssubacteria bacterium]